MNFDPLNILVIDFGQLGDVVLSLPALRAIRERFPRAKITVAAGKPGAEIVNLSGYADSTLVVDRVALRDGLKILSLAKMIRLVKDVRRAQFDFVIDLHSLSETNLLGYLSGAPKRLYSRRPGRSLNYLAKFDPPPPVEDNNPNKHLVDRYLEVLLPLRISNAARVPTLRTRSEDDATVERLLQKEKAAAGTPLVGLYPGAGHPSRRWPLPRFGELADRLVRNDNVRVIVFTGPEERQMLKEIRVSFPRSVIVFDKLTIPQLAAALARLSVLVSNDTGPMHIAAAVGATTVVLLDQRAPNVFLPLGEQHRLIRSHTIKELPAEKVYDQTRAVRAGGRMAARCVS
ncbi:MAG: glycosyltransferase family 9 protein [Pyrinomonadaceae bacterium]